MAVKRLLDWLFGQDDEERAYSARHKARDRLAGGNYTDAALGLRKLAESGDPNAQLELARLYESGKGVVQSFPEAVRWLKPAAEKGLVAAQARLGEILLVGVKEPGHSRESAGTETSAFAQLLSSAPSAKQDFAEAARWNEAAAKGGDVPAQARIGYQYASGLGVPRDAAAAKQWLAAAAAKGNEAGQLGLGMLLSEPGALHDATAAAGWFGKAAEQGSVAAKTCLGLLCMRGQGVGLDEARAATLMTEAANAGHPAAMFYLGEMYRSGRGVPRDLSLAETWLRRAGARGHLQAITACARLLESPEGLNDPDSAGILYRQAAELGDPEAQLLLGEAYLAGRGVPRDPAEGARWLGKAADRGVTRASERLTSALADSELAGELRDVTDHLLRASSEGDASALYQLGKLHLEGAGMRRDPAAAIEHFRKAAEQGQPAAALQLGIQYARGEGVEQNYVEAAQWYRRAAELGLPEGQYNLAFLYLRGLGVLKDPARGRELLEQAAGAGSQAAQVLLGDLLAAGRDLPKDLTAAALWYERAALQGNMAAAAAWTGILQAAGQDLRPVFPVWLKAAEAGDAVAQRIVGDFYLRGIGTAKSIIDAERWLGKAVEQGNTAAMVILGGHLAQSSSSNAERAFLLFKTAAEAGNSDGQYNVATCYLKGFGVAADSVTARTWFAKAGAKGQATT